MVIVVLKVVDGQLGGNLGKTLAKHPVQGEVGGVRRIAEIMIRRRRKFAHRPLGHGQGKELSVKPIFTVEGPGVDHFPGIVPGEMFRTHGPEGIGHEHSVLGAQKEILVPVDFPPLVKHHPHVLRFSSDKFAPVRDAFLMT